MNPQIDHYLAEGCGRCALGGTPQCKVHTWPNELVLLRNLILECGLEEELKWSVPCYTYKGSNILILSAFKEYCSVSFFKGSLLKDTNKVLHKPGENSQSARLFKFTSTKEIIEREAIIKAYIFEAIEVEKAGLKVNFKAKNELNYPAELNQQFQKVPSLKEAFEKLTPGRKRGYILYFNAPKNSATKISRIEKCVEKIFEGRGLNER